MTEFASTLGQPGATPLLARLLPPADWLDRARQLLHPYKPGDGSKAPYSAAGDARGVLCLHGMTGTPFEVRFLAESLAAQGFTALAPLLAGHGTTAEALAATRWPDWLASAHAAVDKLRTQVGERPIGIVGFSMGGLLALRLARERPRDIAALAVLAAPLRLDPREATLIRLLSKIPGPFGRPLHHLPKRNGPDTSDEDMKRLNPGLPVLPVPAIASMLDLGAVVRRDLPSIKAPTLVVHGRHDHVVPFEDSLEIAGSLGSNVIEQLWLDRSFHLLGIDVERRELAAALVKFFSQHLPVHNADHESKSGR